MPCSEVEAFVSSPLCGAAVQVNVESCRGRAGEPVGTCAHVKIHSRVFFRTSPAWSSFSSCDLGVTHEPKVGGHVALSGC